MKIYFDNIIFSLQRAGGISIYWCELIKRFQTKVSIVFYESLNENIFRKDLNISTNSEGIIPVRLLRYLPFFKRLPSNSLFHSSYYRTIYQKDVVKIVTVYDFTYEYYSKGLVRFVHSAQKKMAIKNADGVICISNSTKQDLLNFLPKINENKIKTIYISAGDEFYCIKDTYKTLVESRFKELSNKKIILYVGDRRSGYKNFNLAVETVSSLNDYTFVSVGAGEITPQEKDMIKSKLEGRFFQYLSISSEELNILYNHSFCLLYPSSYEGFGIPIAEAMKAGCPVVSTNLSSIPEVAGDAALLVDHIDVDSFIVEIKKLENDSFRDNLIDKGIEQSKNFSWDKCSEETYQFYKEVYARKLS